MSFFRRFLIVSVCGVVQIFFASYVLLGLLNLNFFELPSDSFLLPGILIILGSSYLTISYYLGDKKLNNMLYDEYSTLRYYKLGAIGYAINGFGVFLIFSMQDWSNWNLVSANRMIYQIAAFAWMVFGCLLYTSDAADE